MADARRRHGKLEFKSPEDQAWYEVTSIKCGQRDDGNSYFEIRYRGVSRRQAYEVNLKESETIENTIQRLRFKSKKLQDSKCRKVEEGMVVCAAYLPNRRFFDAMVKTVRRGRGHPKNICSCRFEIAWEEGLSEDESRNVSENASPPEGDRQVGPDILSPTRGARTTLKLEDIHLLSPGSIEGHEHIQFLRQALEENNRRTEENGRRAERDVGTSSNARVANYNELNSSLESEFNVGSSDGCKNDSLQPEAASTSSFRSGNSIVSHENIPKNNTVEISGAGQVTNERNEVPELPKIEENRNPINLNSPAVVRDFDLNELPKEED